MRCSNWENSRSRLHHLVHDRSWAKQTALTPTTKQAFQNQPNPYTSACIATDPSTPHSSAMMVVLGDASVRSVSPSIAPDTWNKACLPNDGNILPADWN